MNEWCFYLECPAAGEHVKLLGSRTVCKAGKQMSKLMPSVSPYRVFNLTVNEVLFHCVSMGRRCNHTCMLTASDSWTQVKRVCEHRNENTPQYSHLEMLSLTSQSWSHSLSSLRWNWNIDNKRHRISGTSKLNVTWLKVLTNSSGPWVQTVLKRNKSSESNKNLNIVAQSWLKCLKF